MIQEIERNYKRKMSISVSEEIYKILKQKINMSAYIESLVLKENIKLTPINYYEVKIWKIIL